MYARFLNGKRRRSAWNLHQAGIVIHQQISDVVESSLSLDVENVVFLSGDKKEHLSFVLGNFDAPYRTTATFQAPRRRKTEYPINRMFLRPTSWPASFR